MQKDMSHAFKYYDSSFSINYLNDFFSLQKSLQDLNLFVITGRCVMLITTAASLFSVQYGLLPSHGHRQIRLITLHRLCIGPKRTPSRLFVVNAL